MITVSVVGCRKDKPAAERNSPSSEHTTDYGELLAARPVPDLARLAERSSPGYGGKDTIEAFHDILCAIVRREQHDVNVSSAAPLADLLAEFNARHLGHTPIGYHHPDLALADQFKCLAAIARDGHLVSKLG